MQISNGNAPRYEMQATRRTTEHPEGESWPGNRTYLDGPMAGQPIEGCGQGCPELDSGKCGPSADLYFILEKFPSLGAICRLHTGSKTSVSGGTNGCNHSIPLECRIVREDLRSSTDARL